MTEFTRLRMVLSRIDKYLNELYGTDFSKLKQQPLSQINDYLDTYESVVSEIKMDVEKELETYMDKKDSDMEIDEESKEIIIY